ncbi:MAG: M48 family metallopeptidase [Phycisphaerales bacterium]
MLHLLIIALFIVIALHDSVVGGGRFGNGAGAERPLDWAWAATLGPMFALAAATVAVVGVLARRCVERGSWRAFTLADRMLALSRAGVLLLHAANVLALGWLGLVRGVIGDVVALDELAAITPPLLVIIAGWWAYAPIEQQLRQATMYRLLETGQPQYPMVSRGRYVVLNIRHQILLTLAPLGLIAAWSEGLARGLSRLEGLAGPHGGLARVGAWLGDEGNRAVVETGLQLAGVAVIFSVSPLLLRRLWDTVRLSSGPLHDRLMDLCRSSGVKIRGLLVWRTHGTMLNGAVIGLFAPLRYILLTDALLDQLPRRQVEAVMAHEIGHAKHGHMPWLAGSLLAGFGGAAVLVGVVAWGVLVLVDLAGQPALAERFGASGVLMGVMALCSFAAALAWFGFVSRRFEWQADAFAVQQLSRVIEDEEERDGLPTGRSTTVSTAWPGFTNIVTTLDLDALSRPVAAVAERGRVRAEAVEAMTGALDSVAELNHISKRRFTWRHGSIAYRQKRLRELAGRPLGPQPIDRVSRVLKRVVAGGLLLLVGLIVAERAFLGDSAAGRGDAPARTPRGGGAR